MAHRNGLICSRGHFTGMARYSSVSARKCPHEVCDSRLIARADAAAFLRNRDPMRLSPSHAPTIVGRAVFVGSIRLSTDRAGANRPNCYFALPTLPRAALTLAL